MTMQINVFWDVTLALQIITNVSEIRKCSERTRASTFKVTEDGGSRSKQVATYQHHIPEDKNLHQILCLGIKVWTIQKQIH
jgi:hypothetical protein